MIRSLAPSPTCTARSRSTAAFSLFEILVVAGLVAGLAGYFLVGRGGGGVELASAQSVVTNLFAAARARAVTRGEATRILINLGSSGPTGSRRCLRLIVLQEQTAPGVWQEDASVYMPAGVGVLPARSLTPAGLLAEPESWITGDGDALESSLLTELAEPAAVGSYPDDTWSVVSFTAAGMPVPAGGCIALVPARVMPSGRTPPIQLRDPRAVRGVRLSRYGVPVPLNTWSEF